MSSAVQKPRVRARRLGANYALLSGGELVSKVLAAAAFAYLARVLGPEQYGQLEFTLAIIVLFTLVLDSGLSPFGARELARDEAAAGRLLPTIVLLRGLLSVVCFGAVALLALLLDRPWPVRLLMLLYGATLLGLPGLLAWAFQGRDLMQVVAAAGVIRWTAFSAGVFLLVREPDQVWLVAVVEGLAILGAAAFYARSARRTFRLSGWRIDAGYALSTLRQALPIGGSELVWAVKMYFATVLLGLMVGGAQVGWFGAAHRLVIALHTFVWLYFFNLLPALSRSAQGPREGLHRLVEPSVQAMAWSAVLIGLAGTAFAEPALTLLYGADYRDTVAVFQVLIWLVPLALMSGHYRYTLIAYGKQHLEFLTAAGGAALNVGLNVLLVPTYGVVGAGWALVASEALIWGLAFVLVRRTIASFSFWRPVAPPLLAGGLAAVTLYLLMPLGAWIAGAAAMALYGLALTVTQPRFFTDVRALLAYSRP